jgi:hypothetical protein
MHEAVLARGHRKSGEAAESRAAAAARKRSRWCASRMRWSTPSLLCSVVALGACTSGDESMNGVGALGDVPGMQDMTGAPGAGGPAAPGAAVVTAEPAMNPASGTCEDDAARIGRSPIRRLTRFEFNNTVRDLLGDVTQPANLLPPEDLGNGFGNDADAISVSSLLAEQYGTVAEGIADRATSSTEALARLAPCASTVTVETEDACARAIIDGLAPKAFRRPLAQDELDDLFELEQSLRATPTATFATAISGVIQAILQSPDFLYRVEFGVADSALPEAKRLTGDEMATRLSYFLWGTMPDDSLREAARTGELLSPEGVRAQAARMIDDERSRTVIRFFFDNLLPISGLTDIQRDPAIFPAFSSELGAAMREETQRFLEYEIFEGGGTWPSILTAPYTFVNGPLASFYGMTGVTGSDFVKVPLDTSQRLGLLTQAGVMTGTVTSNRSNPVLRGSFVLNRLLCRKLSLPTDPAVLAMVQVPADTTGATARERFSKHSSQAVCRSCHQFLDPIGFALENFDPVGQYRTEENGVTIDASGTIPGTDAPVENAVDLARWLADASDAQSCFASHWLEFAQGRTLGGADECTRTAVNTAFEESGYDVKEMLVSLTQTDAFLYYSGNP